MGFGISFLDDFGTGEGAKEGEQYQKAVEVRSLRLPRVVGGSALAPAPLLQSQGGSGSPFTQSPIQQAMAQMAGLPSGRPPMGPQAPARPMGQPPQARPMAPMAPPPAPRIIPGVEPTAGAPAAPQGSVQRDWTQDAPLNTNFTQPGELLTAAERSSRGYNTSPLQDLIREKWGTMPQGFF